MNQEPKNKTEGLTEEEASFKKRGSLLSSLREFAFLIGAAFVLAYLIKSFVVQPFKIEQQSMLPTLYPKDRVFVNKFIYRFREPERRDIITFRSPREPRILIKRIIGLEGDIVQIKEGKVFINGEALNEKYLNSLPDYSNYGPLTIPKTQVFVMGDNRANSGDSRLFGPLPKKNILGKAFLLYWPPDHFQTIP